MTEPFGPPSERAQVARDFGLPLAWGIGYSLTHKAAAETGASGRYSYMIGP
jgi:hypothetical protein